MVLTDAQWAALAPLIEAVRPHGKTEPHDLRRTVEAILWRHDNGAKWRAIPAELGPWWRAAQTFIRWAKKGVWERLLALVQESMPVAPTSAWRSSTGPAYVRAHAKAAGAAKGGTPASAETSVRRLVVLGAAMGPRP